MKIVVFLNVLISVLVVFIVFNLVIPYSSREGFVEETTPKLKLDPQSPAYSQ